MKRYIGVDKPKIKKIKERPAHWTELPQPTTKLEPINWYDRDNDPASPLEADWDDIHEKEQ